nr:hypothetical protein [Nakamurella lactea]
MSGKGVIQLPAGSTAPIGSPGRLGSTSSVGNSRRRAARSRSRQCRVAIAKAQVRTLARAGS